MTPNSPGTDQIDTLFWIGFVACAIVIVAVLGGLLYAVRRYRSDRGAEPRQVRSGRSTQLRVGGLLTVFAAAIFVASLVYTEKARETPVTGGTGLASAKSQPLEITTTGQQWLWRYDYPNEAFSYYRLVVPVDTTVDLKLVSTDVIHTWDVPALAGKRDAVPGKTNHVVFLANEEGLYKGNSATFSGQSYAAMRTEVEVVSAQEYKDFLARQKGDIQAAQDRVVDLIEAGETP